ncbi:MULTISPECIES: ABC transporter ATP-binding protein [unclassified Nocardioides]|uniref:ABC transporter ATP-binding protein n=1 Tax=unclassified Nocardioides TaxID=2615069 RepID=UPI003614E253
MAADIEPTDALALRAAARSAPKSFGRLSRLVRASVSLVWSSAHRLFIALIALQVLAAVALAGQVLAVKELLSAVLAAESDHDTAAALTPILVLAGLSALAAVAVALQAQLQRLLSESVTRTMWDKVLSVATGVGLRFFESPEFFNRLNRVQTSALVRPYQVTQGLLSAAGALAAGVGLGLVLLGVAPILLPLVVIGGIPLLLTSRRESRLEFSFAVQQTPRLRLRSYLATLQTGRDEAKEIRAFGLGGWLRGRFDGIYADYLHDLRRHVRRRSVLSLVGQVGSAIVLGATLVVLVVLISRGEIGVAAAGAAVVAIRMLGSQVQTLFKGVQLIFESGLFLDDLDEFLVYGQAAVEENSGVEAPTEFGVLRTEGLAFTYPDAEVPALRDIDVELRAGEIVALVGENGSGKTTLAKLLAGLYEPEDGRVLWDDQDAAAFRGSSLRQRITVVFQDFVRYALPATENIAVGRVDDPVDPIRVRTAAAAAGADASLEALPRGYDTVLSRMFADGTDLSGGQWQRVALARSFYRDAPLVILDEPSAALDPRAEHQLFSTLREALHGRTALFISHRFSTVRGADRIYVLHEGEVVEHGSHDDLMARDGRYAELYRLQSDAYVAREGTGAVS